MEKKQISLYMNENQLVNAAIDKIVVELVNKKENNDAAQKILMTGCSPLAGTTSTSISIGIALANCHKKTLLIDCDVRKSLKYKKLNAETTLGLADYLYKAEKEKLPEAEVIYPTNIDNLFYVPCGAYSSNPTRVLCSDFMDNFIETIEGDFEYILFDFPSLAVVPDAQVFFNKVNGIILISTLGETRKKEIRDAKAKIKSYQDRYYGMIVNKVPLDVYRHNVKEYDYYFVDEKGEQNLNGNIAYKRYQKRTKKRCKNGEEK